jgi:hypothetical protein
MVAPQPPVDVWMAAWAVGSVLAYLVAARQFGPGFVPSWNVKQEQWLRAGL